MNAGSEGFDFYSSKLKQPMNSELCPPQTSPLAIASNGNHRGFTVLCQLLVRMVFSSSCLTHTLPRRTIGPNKKVFDWLLFRRAR